MSIQPVTPVSRLRTSMPDLEDGSTDEENLDGHPNYDKLGESPTVGRLSKASRDALIDGFKKLDDLLKQTSAETGLSVIQIIERWDGAKNRAPMTWNIYQAFFEVSQEKEISRLDEQDRPHRKFFFYPSMSSNPTIHALAGAIPSKATIAAAYERFKLKFPDTYDQILQAWYRVRQLTESSGLSVSKRSREFRKFVESIDNLVRSVYFFLHSHLIACRSEMPPHV